jgi:hypothetical protein
MAMRPLPPDDAAVAIQFGRPFEQNRDALARLQNPDTVTIIEVSAVEFVDPIARLLRAHVLGPGAPVLDGAGLTKDATIAAAGTVVLFKRKDEEKSKKSSTDDAELAAAVQRRCAILGIAADADRLLPRGLVRLAEHRIVGPEENADAHERANGRAGGPGFTTTTPHRPRRHCCCWRRGCGLPSHLDQRDLMLSLAHVHWSSAPPPGALSKRRKRHLRNEK